MWFLGEYPVVRKRRECCLGNTFRVHRQTTAPNQLFRDEMPVDSKLTDLCVFNFQVEAYYKLVDVAVDQLEWRF